MNNIENGQSAAEQILVKPIKGWEGLYTIYLEVHRLTANHGVGSSDPKYRGSFQDRDIVKSSLKDEAVNTSSSVNGAELTTPHE